MTDIPLREYLQSQIDGVEKRLCQKISAQDKSVGLALTSAKEAVAKAETAMSARLELLNESRAALKDMVATMLSRNEYTAAHRELVGRIDALEKALAKAAGQQSVWIAFGTAGVAVLLGMADIFVRLGGR